MKGAGRKGERKEEAAGGSCVPEGEGETVRVSREYQPRGVYRTEGHKPLVGCDITLVVYSQQFKTTD